MDRRKDNAFDLVDFYQLFPDFNTAGDNLREALEEAVVSEPEPDPFSWANTDPAKSISDSIWNDLIMEWLPGFGPPQNVILWLDNAIAWLHQRVQTEVISWSTMDEQVRRIITKAWECACDRGCPSAILDRIDPTRPGNAVHCRQVLSHLEELKHWFTEQTTGAHTDNRSDQGKPEHPQEVDAAFLESVPLESGFITSKSFTRKQDRDEQPRGTGVVDPSKTGSGKVQAPVPAPVKQAEDDPSKLDPTQQSVLGIIKKLPKGKGIQGKEILKKLKRKGITLAKSTLYRHVLPKLKPYGVINIKAAGGYLIPGPDTDSDSTSQHQDGI